MEKLTDFYISICHNFLIEYSKVYFDILDKVNTIPTTESEYDEYNYFIKSLDDVKYCTILGIEITRKKKHKCW